MHGMGPPGPADFQTQIEINMGFTMGSTEGEINPAEHGPLLDD